MRYLSGLFRDRYIDYFHIRIHVVEWVRRRVMDLAVTVRSVRRRKCRCRCETTSVGTGGWRERAWHTSNRLGSVETDIEHGSSPDVLRLGRPLANHGLLWSVLVIDAICNQW